MYALHVFRAKVFYQPFAMAMLLPEKKSFRNLSADVLCVSCFLSGVYQ